MHLQGVPLSRRFALVPLGPPLLSYSPTAKVCGAAIKSGNAQMCSKRCRYEFTHLVFVGHAHAWCTDRRYDGQCKFARRAMQALLKFDKEAREVTLAVDRCAICTLCVGWGTVVSPALWA